MSGLDAMLVELGAVSADAAIAPGAFRICNYGHTSAIEWRPFHQAIGMDRDMIRHEPQRSQKFEPEIDGVADGHFPEGEKGRAW